jgi:hypothetical protein
MENNIMVKFMDLTVGQKFKVSINGGPVSEYIKIPEERKSCCHVLTAALLSDPAQKVQVTPLVEVELI